MPKIAKPKDFTFKHSDQPDALYRVMDATQIKNAFDSRALELRNFLISLVDKLNTDGANYITTLPIEDLDLSEENVQKALEALVDLKANKADVYTKDELLPYLKGGDTKIKIEIFNIINPNNGDGTFTYEHNGHHIRGSLTVEGYQIFKLTEGIYVPHENRLEVYIDDHSHRSEASGGIQEVDESTFILTMPEGEGVELTAKYFERVGVAAEYNIRVSPTSQKPPSLDNTVMWFEIKEG